MKWNFKQLGSTAANKFYLFAQSAQIKSPNPPTPEDDHKVYHIVIVPRHATDTTLVTVTKANTDSAANNANAFLKHDVCFKEDKTAPSASCTTTLALPEIRASFFMQVYNAINNNGDDYDKII